MKLYGIVILFTTLLRSNAYIAQKISYKSVPTRATSLTFTRTSALHMGKDQPSEMKSLSDLINMAEEYQKEALVALDVASDSKQVEQLRVAFLGKKGKITGLMKEMRSLAPEDKPKLGEIVNKAKASVENAIELGKVNCDPLSSFAIELASSQPS